MERNRSSFHPVTLGLILVAAVVRLIPHPPNFAPIGGLALFSGARLGGWQAYLVPLVAMAVTDPILSHLAGSPAFSGVTLVIYASWLINVAFGRLFLKNTIAPGRIALVAFACSAQFFLITNFAFWFGAQNFYGSGVAGLTACYLAALPFFGRTVLADLFYSGILFAAHLLITKRFGGVELRGAARG